MSFTLVRLIFESAVLLALTRLCLGALWWCESRRSRYPSAQSWLHAGYVLIALTVLLPIAMLFLRSDLLFLAPFEVGHHPAAGNLQFGLRLDAVVRAPVTGRVMTFPSVDLSWARWVAVVAGVMAAFGGVKFLVQVVQLTRTCQRTTIWKQVRGVRIATDECCATPFCAWTFRGWMVVLPAAGLDDKRRLRMIVAHEFAHIRNKHLHASWLLACLQAATPWNPAVRWWQLWIARLQEIACDQYVLARRHVEPFSYARCLLWAAQASSGSSPGLTTAMSVGSESSLKERLSNILSRHPQRKNRGPLAAVCVSMLAALLTFSMQGFAADRRLSLREAQTIADEHLAPLGVVVTIDELALDGLNRIITGGRGSFRRAVHRLKSYRRIATPIFSKHGIPEPLLGIALAESGVGEGISHQASVLGAGGPRGIWQMTAQTARSMGLRVDRDVDERFDRARELEAVARLLASLHQRFSDWSLVIAAYNMGPEKVEAAMRNGAGADPITLRERGLLNGYLAASVVPAMLVAQVPRLVQTWSEQEVEANYP